jgi:PAS domain S-box-containing protein
MKSKMTSETADLKIEHNDLCSSEIRYRRLFESAKDGILILDAETGQIIDVNPFLTELLGYSHDQFVGKTIWDIGFFRDIIANKENFIELKKNKYIRYENRPLEAADGHKIDVEFVSNVYHEDKFSVIQCNIRDITDRKRVANAMTAESERLSVTLRSINDGVITTDIQGNITIMNKIAEELSGWTQQEALGKLIFPVFNIINENTRKPQENIVNKVLATGETIELAGHAVIISKTGTESLIEASVSPMKDKQNSIIGAVLVFRDITEKQKLLEVSQRNQKLEALGVLAGGIAHDFNNLMGGIFGFIDLAILITKDEKINHYLSKAMSTIDRAKDLTRQLLTFAKGGVPLQMVTPLFPFIQETAQFALSGSNVSSQYDIAKDLWPCIIDKNQIGQVIDNIIINAQQAMPMGGTVEVMARNISIEVEEHPTLLKGNYVRVSIKDYGIGISKKIQPRIFDPFFTTKPKGHGLGLAICYSIINSHGGAIDFESVPDVGSTFHIYLPASKSPL